MSTLMLILALMVAMPRPFVPANQACVMTSRRRK